MKSLYVSDLHMEFGEFPTKEIGNLEDQIDFDAVLIAGDICTTSSYEYVPELREIFPTVPIISTLGNHDYWGGDLQDIPDMIKTMREQADIQVLHNTSTIMGDVVIHGATLWTDYMLDNRPELMPSYEHMMNDFRRTTNGYSRMSYRDIVSEHFKSRDFISNALQQNHPKSIIITLADDKASPNFVSVPSAGFTVSALPFRASIVL